MSRLPDMTSSLPTSTSEKCLNAESAPNWRHRTVKKADMKPTSAETAIERTNVLLGLQRYDEALGLLQPAVSTWPDQVGLWLQLTRALLLHGKPAEALV